MMRGVEEGSVGLNVLFAMVWVEVGAGRGANNTPCAATLTHACGLHVGARCVTGWPGALFLWILCRRINWKYAIGGAV